MFKFKNRTTVILCSSNKQSYTLPMVSLNILNLNSRKKSTDTFLLIEKNCVHMFVSSKGLTNTINYRTSKIRHRESPNDINYTRLTELKSLGLYLLFMLSTFDWKELTSHISIITIELQ